MWLGPASLEHAGPSRVRFVAPRRQPRESFSGSVPGGARKPVAIAPSRPSKPASGEKLRTKV